MSNQTRHEQLINAGWHYDSASDRYRAPGSPSDGTAKLHNLNAAWQEYQFAQEVAKGPLNRDEPPLGPRMVDPRKQEPQ